MSNYTYVLTYVLKSISVYIVLAIPLAMFTHFWPITTVTIAFIIGVVFLTWSLVEKIQD